VRDEARRRRLPYAEAAPAFDEHIHPGPSPLDWILRREMRERCARAFTTLSPRDQEMIAAVVERPCTDRELALRFGKPSAAAARMARHRLRARLASALEA
jgi:DNA-directed RNA polymerase specialized sigma24 family protein